LDTGYTLDMTIPLGSTATMVFPKLPAANPSAGMLGGCSGTHHFVVKDKE
jgi:hypothetical protein